MQTFDFNMILEVWNLGTIVCMGSIKNGLAHITLNSMYNGSIPPKENKRNKTKHLIRHFLGAIWNLSRHALMRGGDCAL